MNPTDAEVFEIVGRLYVANTQLVKQNDLLLDHLSIDAEGSPESDSVAVTDTEPSNVPVESD